MEGKDQLLLLPYPTATGRGMEVFTEGSKQTGEIKVLSISKNMWLILSNGGHLV